MPKWSATRRRRHAVRRRMRSSSNAKKAARVPFASSHLNGRKDFLQSIQPIALKRGSTWVMISFTVASARPLILDLPLASP